MDYNVSKTIKIKYNGEVLEIMFNPLPPRVNYDLKKKHIYRKKIVHKTRIIPKDVHYRPPIDEKELTPYSDYLTELKEYLKTKGKQNKRKKLSKYRCEHFNDEFSHIRNELHHHVNKQRKQKELLDVIADPVKTIVEQEKRLKMLKEKHQALTQILPEENTELQFNYYFGIANIFMSGGKEDETQAKEHAKELAVVNTRDQIENQVDAALNSISNTLNEKELEELNNWMDDDDDYDDGFNNFFDEMQTMMVRHTSSFQMDDEDEEAPQVKLEEQDSDSWD